VHTDSYVFVYLLVPRHEQVFSVSLTGHSHGGPFIKLTNDSLQNSNGAKSSSELEF
jgi:hypothetical protein